MHDDDAATSACAAGLMTAYQQLDTTTADFLPAPLLSNVEADTFVFANGKMLISIIQNIVSMR